MLGGWGSGSGGLPNKTPPTPSSPFFWTPEFSLSVGDNCLGGWSGNTVSQTSGCLGAGRRDRIWCIPASARRDGGRGADRGGVGRLGLPSPTHTEVAWSRIGNSLLGRLIGICCPRDKEIICGIMGRGVSLPGARRSLGARGRGAGRGQRRRDAEGLPARPSALRPALGAPRLGLEEGKSVTVCEISGTKDASVIRKNLLWEQSCRSVIAH